MALSKNLSTQFGVTVTYFKVLETNINWHDRTAHISLGGWLDRTTRDTYPKSPLLIGNGQGYNLDFDWSGEDFPFQENESQKAVEVAYNKIKTDGFWSSANDVLEEGQSI